MSYAMVSVASGAASRTVRRSSPIGPWRSGGRVAMYSSTLWNFGTLAPRLLDDADELHRRHHPIEHGAVQVEVLAHLVGRVRDEVRPLLERPPQLHDVVVAGFVVVLDRHP